MFSQSSIEKIKTKKIYALEGNIGAGKTTILKMIAKHFKDVEFMEEPVKEWRNEFTRFILFKSSKMGLFF